jgi:hypothetical protein
VVGVDKYSYVEFGNVYVDAPLILTPAVGKLTYYAAEVVVLDIELVYKVTALGTITAAISRVSVVALLT